MRKQPQKVLFPTMLEFSVQDNGDGTWTAILALPIGDGNPHTSRRMEEAVKTAAIASGYKPFPGGFPRFAF